MAYSFTVLLDRVYCSKHSPILIMGGLRQKTCVLHGNFCSSPQSKTPGHLRAFLFFFFFLKRLSELCFPDFQAYIKWWEKNTRKTLPWTAADCQWGRLPERWKEDGDKKDRIKIILWLYGTHHCFMHVLGKNPGGQMETWNGDAFESPGERIPLNALQQDAWAPFTLWESSCRLAKNLQSKGKF